MNKATCREHGSVLFYFIFPLEIAVLSIKSLIKHLDSPSADLTPQENSASIPFKAEIVENV